MDKPLSIHEKKATKQIKTKKKTVKVVYISNPMKVTTTASEFRALVQELTGQDAFVPDPSKYSEIDGVGSHQTVPDGRIEVTDDHALEVPRMEPASEVVPKRSDLTFEPYDDVFMSQMLENFNGLLPSNLFEFPHVDVLKSLDAV